MPVRHDALPQAPPSCRQQASAAALAQVYWQPVAVQQAHGQGVAAVQQPLDVRGYPHVLTAWHLQCIKW